MAEGNGIAYWRPNTVVSPIVDGTGWRSAGGASARRTAVFINTRIGAPGHSGSNTVAMTVSSNSEVTSRILYSRCAARSSRATRRVPTHTALASAAKAAARPSAVRRNSQLAGR